MIKHSRGHFAANDARRRPYATAGDEQAVPACVVGSAIPDVVAAGTEILEQDVIPADVAWIADGVVQLVRHSEDGTSSVIGLRFPGWFLGAESAIVGLQLPMAAVALTRCEIHRIRRQKFVQLVKTESDLSWRILDMHSRQILDQMRQSTKQRVSPAHRLKRFIRQLLEANAATPIDKRVQLRLPINPAQLAQLLAVRVDQIPRLLDELQRENCVEIAGDVVTIVDERQLLHSHVHDVGWPINAASVESQRGRRVRLLPSDRRRD